MTGVVTTSTSDAARSVQEWVIEAIGRANECGHARFCLCDIIPSW